MAETHWAATAQWSWRVLRQARSRRESLRPRRHQDARLTALSRSLWAPLGCDLGPLTLLEPVRRAENAWHTCACRAGIRGESTGTPGGRMSGQNPPPEGGADDAPEFDVRPSREELRRSR